MTTPMESFDAIKAAVKAGKTVHWSNTGYRVVFDSAGQWLVVYTWNDHCASLFFADGVSSDYQPEDFFLGADQ